MWRRSQVVKAGACKSSFRRFDSARRLQTSGQVRGVESSSRSLAMASVRLFSGSRIGAVSRRAC